MRASLWIALALALIFRTTALSTYGFSEDEIAKVRAVDAYKRGDFRANAEHPLLMKLAMWASTAAAEAWNARVPARMRVAPETALRVLTEPIFETAQVIYNIYDRSPEKALFDFAKQKPLGIIARVPFDEGALTGQITAKTVFPAGDWRAEYFAGERKAEAERRAKALAAVLDDQVETLPELALRFCLSSPVVSTVIPGMRRPAHVRHNVTASAKGALPPGMVAKLKSHAWEKNWY